MKYINFSLILLFLFSCTNMNGVNVSSEEMIDFDIAVPHKPVDKTTPKTWKRAHKQINTATVFVGDNEKLPLKGSQIGVKIDGFRARVLIDFFFKNNENRQLEGTFKMKLPQGASPYYFAFGESVLLDESQKSDSIPFIKQNEMAFSAEKIEEMRSKLWSSPKVAKVVEKEKAAFAYGQTVRRRVDPALVEWAGADVYNCRIFPLMPNKLHRVVIGYEVNLTSLDNDLIFNFPVPEIEGPLVLDFDIANINGVKSTISPQLTSNQENGRQTFRLTNPKEKELTIRYHSLNNLLLRSPNDDDNQPYFATLITPELPTSSKIITSDRAIIVLDVSLSSNPDKFNIWLKLIEAILMNNQNEIRQFNVLLFNIETFWWKEGLVKNNAENVSAFLNYANQITLEGASDINLALSSLSSTNWAKSSSNNIFLLSDGADTWGEEDHYEMSKNINPNDHLFAYNTGMSGTDLKNLNHLTRASGGATFSVTGEDEVQKVSTAFRFNPWKIEDISIAGGKDLLIAGRPEYIYPGQKLLVSGRGVVPEDAALELQLSNNNVQKNSSIDLSNAITSALTPRIYGQMATMTLEEFGYATGKTSVAYAKHFNVPGMTCSLLMLESEEDYEQYNIRATEDAYVVKSMTVNQILDDVLLDIEKMLGSAKAKFTKWLEKLTQTDGIDFTVPSSMEIIIDKIPESSFSVNQKTLSSKSYFNKDVPKNYLDSLKYPNLNYDQVTKEAERRLDKYGSNDALKALSSLVERNPGNSVLSRDVAYSALDWGLHEQAYYLFKRVLKTRPYEPQTYLAMANSLAKLKNFELSLLYYEIAITAKWNDRFGEFRKIAVLEYLNLLGKIKDENNFRLKDYAQSRFKTLKAEFKEEDADLMLVISWNTDNTDIDLHVIEPTGEECYYQNRDTKLGGHLTADVTQGYGPEMYILQEGKKGEYKVKVKYFSSDRNRTSTRTKVYATIYRNWGKKNESVTTKVITLEDNKEMHEVITIDLK